MKKLVSVVLTVLLVFSFGFTSYAEEAEVKKAKKNTAIVDLSKTYQTIEGFGASYTWYSDWLTNINDKETGYDWIFNDAEFNILRFRDLNGVKGDEKNIPIEGYKAYSSYYNAAVARGIDPIVLVTSWGQYDRSLPFVAFNEKSEKGYSYYTLAKDENGEYMYDELAAFCVQSMQYFFDAGIPVHYFSISNEIELQELHKDEQGNARNEAGFFFGPEETDDYCAYYKAHLAVYDAFQKAFGDKAPSIVGAETMAGTPSIMDAYLAPLIKDHPEKLDVVAHHLYGTSLSAANFQELQKNYADYRLWQTEWYSNDYIGLGDVILNELISENLTAYLYWNGVWIEDNGNCLIEISTWAPDAVIKRLPGHYIMMHFSKFIKNGYKRVDVTEELSSKVGAFLSPDENELVVVVSNNYVKADNLFIDINREIKDSKVYRSTKTTETYMEELGTYEPGMKIPAMTLTTIVLELGDEIVPEVVEPEVVEPETPEVTEPEDTNKPENAGQDSTDNTELGTTQEPEDTDSEETAADIENMNGNNNSGNDELIFIIVGVVLGVAVIGGIVAVLIIKRKKSN